MKHHNNRIIIKKLVKDKKDLDVLESFRCRIGAVMEDEAFTLDDVLKTVQSAYTFIRIIIPDSKIKNASDFVVEQFIQIFLNTMDEHIASLKQNEMNFRFVKIKTNSLE
jgi:hypothetical protein